jgi:hypothetical protein
MKHLKYVLLFIAICVCTLNSFPQPNSPLKNGFYLGTFSFPTQGFYYGDIALNKYDSLSYNIMVGYTSHCDINEWCKIWGGFWEPVIQYSANLNTAILAFRDRYVNNGKPFYLFLEREKILRPAYGQSSKYQAV